MFSPDKWFTNPSTGFYPHTIGQSLRFDKASSTVLHRTPSGAGNRKTWSFSCWIKRSNLTETSTGQSIFSPFTYKIILSAAVEFVLS